MQIEATYLVPLSSLSENLWYYSQIEITPLKCLKMPFRTENSNSVLPMRQNPFGQLLWDEKKSMETNAIYGYSHLQSIFICLVIFLNRWQQLLKPSVIHSKYSNNIIFIGNYANQVESLIEYVKIINFIMNMRIFFLCNIHFK